MPISYVHYDLENGFIHNWLVAGPQAIPVDMERFAGGDVRQRVAQFYYKATSGITKTPVERGPLTEGTFKVGNYTGTWSYFACREDHLVDQSATYLTCHYLRSWAYTQTVSETAQDVLLVLTTHGPADVWLNGKHIHRQEHWRDQHPASVPFKVRLKKGTNKILVRFEGVAIGECPHAMALRVCQSSNRLRSKGRKTASLLPATGVQVRIPTLIQSISRRNEFEQVAAAVYVDRDVFERDDLIQLRWPDDLEQSSFATVRLQASEGQIYAEATVDGTAGDQVFLNYPYRIPEGPHRIVVMPRTWEYYERNMRITRELGLWNLGNNRSSDSPYGTYQERRQESLIHAARSPGTVFSQVAKMALGWWSEVEIAVLRQAVKDIEQRQVGSERLLLGLLGMLYRFGHHPEFTQSLRQPLEDCILNFRYRHDGDSNAAALAPARAAESHGLLLHTCEILAGQLYPDRTFAESAKTGLWHRQQGEQLALAWLYERGAYGWKDWDSNVDFADDLLALSHLIDLAETDQVWEMATVVMDKLLFTLALNSYKGVFGSTHGRSSAQSVKGGLLEPTSGITRLMWGMGIFNHHIAGTVSLACMEKYELPSIISDIALALPEEMWNCERHVVSNSSGVPSHVAREVNKVTYKTPDYMLCSAQDYYPGERGNKEHIWQATLGPTAVVFVSHPACTSEDEARWPNFWLGNASLPRVAQWKDVLIAIHNLPEDDWMGFTHAYFPTYAFDEHVLREGADGRPWAFARKGDGYLALTASQGFYLVKRGHYALRELRSYGQHNVWLCHMGRAALDGEFGAFQEKMLALDVTFDDLSVRCRTLRGQVLSLGWQGPFLRDGREQPLTGFRHYENPYTVAELPCTRMEIQREGELLRLDLSARLQSDVS